ncbi:GldG family protein [Paenibacillus thiaminolyticus]|uniref:GldG family protein n=1 Tax=Paenibacillus thiaminolyticus TaxID=49283 RepID=UPI0035A5C76C
MKTWLRRGNAAMISAAVVGIFVLITYIFQSFSGWQWDVTKNKSFTLSEQTLSALASIENPIAIKLFATSNDDEVLVREVADMAEEYAKRNRNISFNRYDLLKEPSLAEQYKLTASSIVLEQGTQRKTVGLFEMFQAGQGYSYQFSGEEKMTQALRSLASDKKSKAYVLSGHQELSLAQMNVLRTSLEEDSVELEDLNLLQKGSIPEDADLIMLIGIKQDLSDKEAELLLKYMEGNGKLYIALGFNEKMATEWPNIDALLKSLGVESTSSVAVEPSEGLLYDPFTIMPDYNEHEMTEKLIQYRMMMTLSLSIPLKLSENDTYEAQEILHTTEQAYGETDIPRLVQEGSEWDDKDIAGPLTLGAVVQSKDGQPKAVVVGGSSYMADAYIYTQGNRDFALNSIHWLEENQDQVTIRPRENDTYQLAYLTPVQGKTILWVTVIGFPAVLLLIGTGLWWRRRHAS